MNVVFLTLFLGLVAGPEEVRVAVGSDVSAVEIRLDGAPAARLKAPAWRGTVDFGPSFLPHDLEAIAFDPGEREVGRTRIRVNMPRPKAEASFVLEPRDETGRQMVRLHWESTVAAAPRTVRITLDGESLDVEEPFRFAIPEGEPGRVRILRADLRFGKGVTAAAEAFLGSHDRDYTSAELSAVPVVLERRKDLPPPEELSGWLLSGGRPLRVVAVERGPADVVFLVDPRAESRLEKILSMVARIRTSHSFPTINSFRLSGESLFYFVLPLPVPAGGTRYVGVPLAGPFSSRDGGVLFTYLEIRKKAPLRNADHVARVSPLTGMAAVSRCRRRAAVWILDAGRPTDDPDLDRGRRYLASLNVPLFVWRVGPGGGPAPGSGPESRITLPSHVETALSSLEETLDRQQIVWVEGQHLPQTITLSTKAEGIALAR